MPRVDSCVSSPPAAQSRKNELLVVWKTLAARLRGRYRIAAYEPLSEPRISADDSWWVTDFYSKACATLQVADAGSACLIGATPFYSRDNLERVLMKQRQLLYAFNFYVPKAYLMPAANGTTAAGTPMTSLRYPASFACCDVYTDDHVCKSSSGKAGCVRPIRVDGRFLQGELQKAVAFRDKFSVPVLLDQVGGTAQGHRPSTVAAHILIMRNTAIP